MIIVKNWCGSPIHYFVILEALECGKSSSQQVNKQMYGDILGHEPFNINMSRNFGFTQIISFHYNSH